MGSRSGSPEPPELSGDDEAPENILVGLALKPHGLRGEVRMQVFSDVPGRFDIGQELLLVARGSSPRRVTIASFRPLRGGGVIRFEGYEDRDQAEELRGARLEVLSSEVPEAPEGMYYFFELVGCRCIDEELGDLGVVKEVIEDGGGLLLEVVSDGRSLSLPFVEHFLVAVDVAQQEIRWRLPSGLVETCASKS